MAFNPADYHPKWPLIRRLILRRAGGRCEWCAARNHRPHPRTGSRVILAVAHLDRARAHNRFHNLALLCRRCHLAHDRPQHLMSRRAGREWQRRQLSFDFPPGPLECAYRAGLVQLVPLGRLVAQQEIAAGRQAPRRQLWLQYEPLRLMV